jgi:DNA (cytosine-5)-methyltransferase 1
MLLMGYTEQDYYILKKNKIPETQIYKLSGNTIVVNVLDAIFKQLLNIKNTYQINNKKYKIIE